MATPPFDSDLGRALAVHCADAFIVTDREGFIRFWNRGAELLFGHGAGEALGQSVDLIVPERFRAAHGAGYRRAMASGGLRLEGRVLTTRSEHKDGRRLYVDLSFGLLRDEAGTVTGAFAIGRDCTERFLERRSREAAADGTPPPA